MIKHIWRLDGSHSLYKVIRSFKTGKPHERVQLRDEQGRFLTAKEERQVLEDYSKDLFGTGDDFQLQGSSGSLGITSSDVMDQLRSIKLGKAVPRDCPPIVAWRSLGLTGTLPTSSTKRLRHKAWIPR